MRIISFTTRVNFCFSCGSRDIDYAVAVEEDSGMFQYWCYECTIRRGAMDRDQVNAALEVVHADHIERAREEFLKRSKDSKDLPKLRSEIAKWYGIYTFEV